MLYTGVTGKISISTGVSTTTYLAHMATWSVDLTKNIIEVVSFGDDYKEKIPSIKDWSASGDGKADFGSSNGQVDLLNAFENGTKVKAAFYLDENTFFTGDAYIESLTVNHAADGAGDISISLAGSGKATLTLPTA